MEPAYFFPFPFVLPHDPFPCFVVPVFVVFLFFLFRPPGRSRGRLRRQNSPDVSMACPRCSTANRPMARYCANCGLKLPYEESS